MTIIQEPGRVVRPVRRLEVLSNSAVSCFRTCPRKFRYTYVMLRRPRRKVTALAFGTLFHVGLNAWWSVIPAEYSEAGAAWKFELSLHAMRKHAEEKETDPFDLVKAEELMLGYTARWGSEEFETLFVERKFNMPLVNPETGRTSRLYRIQGSIDAIAKAGDKTIFVEHKTTSSDIEAGSTYWRKVSALDSQVSTYTAAAKATGIDLDSCVYDVVRKVTLSPKKATPEESRRYTKAGRLDARQRETDETPEEFRLRVREHISENPERYYARGPIVRLENDEREAAGDLWQTAQMIRSAETSGHFPRNPGACEKFGRFCEYFDVCSGTASIHDDMLFRTADTAHEELAETKEV
jgi:Holliday junction resolvase-like predicted endonuclease